MSSILPTIGALRRLEMAPSLTARRVIGVAVFTVATALSARLAIPVPGTPVPFTFQLLVVLLSGALLGPRLGAASQTAYLAAGALGLPVFAAGGGVLYLLGPTGGYLLAFPVAAFVVGSLMGRGWLRPTVALLAGLAVVFAGGVAWLAVLGFSQGAIALGLKPFLLAGLVKVALALLLVRAARERSLELFTG